MERTVYKDSRGWKYRVMQRPWRRQLEGQIPKAGKKRMEVHGKVPMEKIMAGSAEGSGYVCRGKKVGKGGT